MITTNIDATDGLTNGAMGTVTNVVIDDRTGKMSTILVSFDSKQVVQEAMHTSVYKNTIQMLYQYIKHKQHFPYTKKHHIKQQEVKFPLTFAWAVTIHKCQGLTLPEIVIDMTPAKGKFKPGQAYVAFSRVRTIDKLHIINYTGNQIHVSEHVEEAMKRLRKNTLPQMPSNLFQTVPGGLKLLHINIGNLKTKIADIKNDIILQNADIIALNETQLGHSDTLTPHMIGISQDRFIVHCDHNNRGGGVALIIKTNLKPKHIRINTILDILVVEISEPIHDCHITLQATINTN